MGPAAPVSSVNAVSLLPLAAFVSSNAWFGTVVLRVETPEALAAATAPGEEAHRLCERGAGPAVRGEYHGCRSAGKAKQFSDEGERHAVAAEAVQGARPEALCSIPWWQWPREQEGSAATAEDGFRRET